MLKPIKRSVKAISLIILTFFSLCSTVLASDPIVMLQSVANQMIHALKSNQATLKNNPTVVYALTSKIIVPHADLDEMSQRVLPPEAWHGASAIERAKFQKAFTTVLIRTYASALASYKDQSVRFYPIRGNIGKTATVNSQVISSDAPPIPVSFRVVLKGSQWKLYDMSVEGVSMLESFRAQFSDQLSQGNMMRLIETLQQHNARNS